MSKTPYELRFQILEMARDHVMQPYWDANNAWHDLVNEVSAAINEGRLENSMILERIELMKPVMPSTEEIKQKAKEFQQFVDGK